MHISARMFLSSPPLWMSPFRLCVRPSHPSRAVHPYLSDTSDGRISDPNSGDLGGRRRWWWWWWCWLRLRTDGNTDAEPTGKLAGWMPDRDALGSCCWAQWRSTASKVLLLRGKLAHCTEMWGKLKVWNFPNENKEIRATLLLKNKDQKYNNLTWQNWGIFICGKKYWICEVKDFFNHENCPEGKRGTIWVRRGSCYV